MNLVVTVVGYDIRPSLFTALQPCSRSIAMSEMSVCLSVRRICDKMKAPSEESSIMMTASFPMSLLPLNPQSGLRGNVRKVSFFCTKF